MVATQSVNVTSPPSSLSGSSFSVLPSESSVDNLETFEESSSDDDEVLWTGNEFESDDDFILVPHLRIQSPSDSSDVIQGITRLSLSTSDVSTPPSTPITMFTSPPKPKLPGVRNSKSAGNRVKGSRKPPATTVPVLKTPTRLRNKNKNNVLASYPTPSSSPHNDRSSKSFSGGKEKGKIQFGLQPLVESDEESQADSYTSKYEEAVSFITSILNNPSSVLNSSTNRLTFLQSLIIELGLLPPCSSTLPITLTSAKRFLKARAFINVGDYLSVRQQGLEQLQQIMFKSKRALADDLRKNRGQRKADKGWVKRHGLNVFLVSVF